MNMRSLQSGPEPCHNCRRQRLKCDRSLPRCLKCVKKGRECLGYGYLLRWDQGVASRGKMAGRTFGEVSNEGARHGNSTSQVPSTVRFWTQKSPHQKTEPSRLWSLADPLVQDADHASRRYLSYFASDVCKDLVLYDTSKHNLFRELIPLTHHHPVLLHVIIASAALHMSNTCQDSLVSKPTSSLFRRRKSSEASSSSCHNSTLSQHLDHYKHALAAKQRSLCLLKSALANLTPTDVDVALAVVLLSVEFELIDSGRDNWRHHVNGARTIIKTYYGQNAAAKLAMSPLSSCLISNCLVLGSAFASPTTYSPDEAFPTGTLSLLQDAEGNHCSSFPETLLQLLQSGAQLSQSCHPSPPLPSSRKQYALSLLSAAQSFDPLAWATQLQQHSPASDVLYRTQIASAHRAAVCIYLSRVLLSIDATTHLSKDLEALVSDVISHLSFIHACDHLFKATTWPAFVAGAETHDREKQEWVTKHFEQLWKVEPWGLIRGVLGVLDRIWADRRSNANHLNADDGAGGWLAELRGKGVDWLVI